MNKIDLKQIRSLLVSGAFRALFLFLPITSLPLLSKVFGSTSVAPLAAIPALILVIILVLPTLFKKQAFSYQFLPLILFFVFALISTFFVFFRNAPSFRETFFLKNSLESIITFLMGISFYFLCAHFINTEEKIHIVLKWMNIGAILIVIFSLFQARYMYTPIEKYPAWLSKLTFLISSSFKIFPRRISGLAFEPSWLAHQLNILYLPIWLGFSIKRYSVYKIRLFKKITIENVLLVLGAALLFLSFSRIGWITFVVLIIFIMSRAANNLFNKLIAGIEKKRGATLHHWEHGLAKFGLWFGVFIAGAILALLAGLIISKLDPTKTAQLLNFAAIKEKGILGWANLIKIAERIVYWIIGFRTFQLFPWIGVGLGAIGYYFPIVVPEFGYGLLDVIHAINRESFISNAKNLWSRLLGETGIIGTALFVSWIFLQWKTSNNLEKQSNHSLYSTFGLVGKLFVLAFIFEGFSMDTFGLPYYWIAFGLVVAVWRMMKQENANNPTEISRSEGVPDRTL